MTTNNFQQFGLSNFLSQIPTQGNNSGTPNTSQMDIRSNVNIFQNGQFALPQRIGGAVSSSIPLDPSGLNIPGFSNLFQSTETSLPSLGKSEASSVPGLSEENPEIPKVPALEVALQEAGKHPIFSAPVEFQIDPSPYSSGVAKSNVIKSPRSSGPSSPKHSPKHSTREEKEEDESDSESEEEEEPVKRRGKAKDRWIAWVRFTPGPVVKDIELIGKNFSDPVNSNTLYQYGHHVELIRILQGKRFAFTASETGSGKTYVIGRIYSKMRARPQSAGFSRMLVVGPVSAEATWSNLCDEFGIDGVSFISYSGLASRKNSVINHPFLSKEIKTTKSGGLKINYKITKDFVDVVNQGLLLVIDECHRVKNKETSSSKALKTLTSYIAINGGVSRFIFLSATPYDKPEHSKTVYGLIGVSTKKMYGKSFTQDWEWKTMGLGQIVNFCKELNPVVTNEIISNYEDTLDNNPTAQVINEVCYNLYRDVFVPAIVRSMMKPPLPDELKPEYYNLFMYMNESEHQIYNDAVTKIPVYGDDNGKGIISGLVHKNVEVSKLTSTIRTIRYFHKTQPNAKIIVYQNHIETLLAIANTFRDENPLIYSGDVKLTKKKDRKGIVNKFNEPNLNHWLMVASTKAGGESISLHDTDGRFPRIMLISPSFHFIESVQAAGRTNRIGVKSKPVIYFLYGGYEGLELRYLNTTVAKSRNTKGTLQKEIQSETIYPGDYPIIHQLDDMSLLKEVE